MPADQTAVSEGKNLFPSPPFVLERSLIPSQRQLVERSRKGADLSFLGLAFSLGTWDFGEVQPASLAETKNHKKTRT